MSTAIHHPHHHPHRSQMIAGGVAVLAVVAAGVIVQANRDNGSSASGGSGTGTSQSQVKLSGSSHQQGNWNSSATTSGGRTMPGQ